jgi:hypothetical protein
LAHIGEAAAKAYIAVGANGDHSPAWRAGEAMDRDVCAQSQRGDIASIALQKHMNPRLGKHGMQPDTLLARDYRRVRKPTPNAKPGTQVWPPLR